MEAQREHHLDRKPHAKPAEFGPATTALSSLVAAVDQAEVGVALTKPPQIRDLNQNNSDTDGSSNGPSGSASDSASSRSGSSQSCPPYQKNLNTSSEGNEHDDADTYDDDDLSGEGASRDGGDKEDGSESIISHTSSSSKINKPRWAISKQAKFILEQVYQMERFPSAEMRRRLAADFNVEPRQVQFWYQNRRQRDSRALRAAQFMASSAAPDAESHGSSNAEAILHQLRMLNETRRNLGIHQQRAMLEVHAPSTPQTDVGLAANTQQSLPTSAVSTAQFHGMSLVPLGTPGSLFHMPSAANGMVPNMDMAKSQHPQLLMDNQAMGHACHLSGGAIATGPHSHHLAPASPMLPQMMMQPQQVNGAPMQVPPAAPYQRWQNPVFQQHLHQLQVQQYMHPMHQMWQPM